MSTAIRPSNIHHCGVTAAAAPTAITPLHKRSREDRLTAGNVDIFGAIPVLNPDVFVNILHSSGTRISAISAGNQVLRLAKDHLARRKSFAVETTLSGKNHLQDAVCPSVAHSCASLGRGTPVEVSLKRHNDGYRSPD
jgi:hypothetical protein